LWNNLEAADSNWNCCCVSTLDEDGSDTGMERRHVAYVVKILMSCWASVVSKMDRKMIPVEMRLFMVDKESAAARMGGNASQ